MNPNLSGICGHCLKRHDPRFTPCPPKLPAIERAVSGYEQVHIDSGLDGQWHVTALRYDSAIGRPVSRRVTVPLGASPAAIEEQLALAFTGRYEEAPTAPRARRKR